MACACGSFVDAARGQFTPKKAAAEIDHYRRKGPDRTTQFLRDGLAEAGLVKGSLLDVGGGVGALSFELLDRGVSHTVVVDASSAYLAAAEEEARRRDRTSTAEFVHGDFVDVSPELPQADVVALDRVVCCYPSYEPLLESALAHAKTAFAYSYPRDRWYVRIVVWVENAVRRLSGCPFRTLVHPASEMGRIIQQAGFQLANRRATLGWSADVFVRRG